LWREADLEVKMLKTLHCRSTLGSLDVEGISKTLAGVGHLKRICKDAFAWQGQHERHMSQTCQEILALIS